MLKQNREVSEWLKEQAWKVCIWVTVSWVRIPSSLQKKCHAFSVTFFLNYSRIYFPLLASAIYFSRAIVIEGVSGVGARISILNPCSKASF